MNPFDLSGPEFLGFYLKLGAGMFATLVLALWVMRRRAAAAPLPREPYAVAYLRGGSREAARVAALSLVSKSLVLIRARRKSFERSPFPPPANLRPIEHAALLAIEEGSTLRSIVRDRRVRDATDEIRAGLKASGHLSSANSDRPRRALFTAVSIVLLGTAATKLVVALVRGRTNVFFLIVLAAFYGCLLLWLFRWSEAHAGRSAVRTVRDLIGRSGAVHATASSLRDNPETLLRAAAIGVIGGPFSSSGALRARDRATNSDGATHCGGGCGGGAGGGDGGGGGGGCGGGCGGCGGS